MAKTEALSAAAPAVVERAQGRRPSRTKSVVTAGVLGLSAAVLTYRLLRRPHSGREDDSTEGG